MLVQTLVAEPTIETFHEGVLNGFPGSMNRSRTPVFSLEYSKENEIL